jgi:excisionase family DNA binding protein
MRKTYTTGEAADAVGITRATLQAWIAKKWLRVPAITLRGGRAVRLWTESDLDKLRVAKKKLYGAYSGRPKKK